MRRNGHIKIELVCGKMKPDDNNGLVACGSTSHYLSGCNTWVTIRKGDKTRPPIKVLQRRIICKGCGQFNYVHLDGSPIKDEYSDYEIKKLQRLTKELQEKKSK